ncbi:MAG: alpha/beta hydrolase [Candidatus Promineifilaceae bacterium]|nr:alpha/beta hydrolase [Candidatus Promineifilaceae bacterium]
MTARVSILHQAILRRHVVLGAVELAYLEIGPPAAPTMLLLHGIPTGAELWRETMVPLGLAGYRVCAPDLPGYGQTRVPATGDHSLAGAADLLARWMETAQLGPSWVVGHDLGGAVAQILAVRRPRLVQRLTLTNTVVGDSWPVRPVKLLRLLARLRLYVPLAALGLFPNPYATWELRRAFTDPQRLRFTAAQRVFWDGKIKTHEGRQAFSRHLRALDPVQTEAIVGQLGQIAAPVQIVWGRQDPFQPWARIGRRLVGLLPNPAVQLLNEAGHFTPLEQPEALAAALLAWVADHD